TTRAGLTVRAELDTGTYPLGVKVTSDDMSALAITPHHWHGDWNYTLHPRLATPPDPPAAPARPAPADPAPPRPSHPPLPGHDPAEWNRPPASLPPRTAASLASRPSASAGTRILSPRDQLLATVLKLRWSAHNNTLASLFGVHQHTIANAIRQTTRDLADIGHHVPAAPIKARTTRDPAPLIGLEHAAKPECPINNPTAPWDHFHARDIRFGRPQAVICAPEGNGVVRRRSGRSSGRTATAWDRAGPDTGIRRWLIHTDVRSVSWSGTGTAGRSSCRARA